jgi:hypothetical protein
MFSLPWELRGDAGRLAVDDGGRLGAPGELPGQHPAGLIRCWKADAALPDALSL